MKGRGVANRHLVDLSLRAAVTECLILLEETEDK